jgi:hypothetical protein
MRVIQRERETLDARLSGYFRRGCDLRLRNGDGEEQKGVAAAMAVQEARSGIEVVGKLGGFSLDGDEGCVQE